MGVNIKTLIGLVHPIELQQEIKPERDQSTRVTCVIFNHIYDEKWELNRQVSTVFWFKQWKLSLDWTKIAEMDYSVIWRNLLKIYTTRQINYPCSKQIYTISRNEFKFIKDSTHKNE